MTRVVLLLAGLALLVYLVAELGPGEILAMLGRIGWGFVPLAGLFAAHQAIRAVALRLCAVRSNAVRLTDALAVRLSGEAVQFLTSTGPFLAEPSKAMLLGRRGLTTTEGFAATLAEYLSYTFVSAAMLAGAMVWMLATVELPPALRRAAVALLAVSLVFLAVAAVAIARRVYLLGGVVARLGRAPVVGRRLRYEPGAVRRMEDLLLGILHERPGRFLRVLLLETLAHAVLVAELWWILRLSGEPARALHVLVLESAGKFTTLAFFFVPGQLGAMEGVNAVLFETLGYAAAAGVGVALARRIRSVLAAGAGLAALAWLTRRDGRS